MNKKFIKLFTSVFVFLFIMGTLPVYALDLTSPKTEYLKIEAKNLKKSQEKFSEEILEVYNDYMKKYNVPTQVDTEFSVDLQGTLPEDEMTKAALDILRNTKLKINGYSDEKSKKVLANIVFNIKGNDLLTMTEILDNDKIIYRVPDIHDKYFILDLKKAKNTTDSELKEAFAGLPTEMLNADDFLKALDIDQKKIEKIMAKYVKAYSKNLTKEQVTIAEARFVDGLESQKAKTYTVNFTRDEYANLIKAWADELAQDEDLANLIYNNFSGILNLYKNAGILDGEEIPEISLAATKDVLKDIAESLKADLEGLQLNQDVKMVLYVDEEGNILKRTVDIDTKDGGLTKLVTTDYLDSSKVNVNKITITNVLNGLEKEVKMIMNQKEINNFKKQNAFVFLAKETSNGQQTMLTSFSLNFLEEKTNLKENSLGYYEFIFKEGASNINVTGDFDYRSDLDSKGRQNHYDFDFSVNIPKSDIKVLVNNTADLKYEVASSLPNYQANAVDVFALNAEELEKLEAELEEGMGLFAIEMMEKLDLPMFEPLTEEELAELEKELAEMEDFDYEEVEELEEVA